MKAEPVDTHIGSAPLEVNVPSSSVLADVLKRQNEITELLVKQQITSLLPNREIPIFDGDPLQFRSFIRAFQQGVGSKTDNMQDRLNYLEQFTSGQPRQTKTTCCIWSQTWGSERQWSSSNGILEIR